jgi:hypothetical protein
LGSWASCSHECKGAFPPSHFSDKLDDKLAHKVASQTNVTLFCLVCQSEVCCKPNWFATNSVRQLCKQVCHQVCCKNVMVETHLKSVCGPKLRKPEICQFRGKTVLSRMCNTITAEETETCCNKSIFLIYSTSCMLLKTVSVWLTENEKSYLVTFFFK